MVNGRDWEGPGGTAALLEGATNLGVLEEEASLSPTLADAPTLDGPGTDAVD